MQERVWLQRFQQYIDDNVLPVWENPYGSESVKPSIQVKHVLRLLSCHSTTPQSTSIAYHPLSTIRVPVEYDILTVKILMTKFTSSFQATNPLKMSQSGSDITIDPAVQSSVTKNCGSYSELHEVPALLMGCLKPSVCGGLVLQDSTGDIDCEVSDIMLSVYVTHYILAVDLSKPNFTML